MTVNPDQHEGDFGLYLGAIAERDMDLLLLEELHVNPEFLEQFAGELGFSNAEFLGAWHSISDSDGETDLLLRVRCESERIGILIENKIGAAEQERQDERYHIRGVRAQHDGKFERFVTCICAPVNYLDGMRSDSLYQQKLSYEKFAEWFGQYEDRRSSWKRKVVLQAIAQSRRGYTMAVNKVTTAFHDEYWHFRRDHYPHILMRKPGEKGPKSTWIIMRAPSFPKGVQIHHKLDQSVVELGFDRRTVEQLRALGRVWPPGVVPDQKGGTAVLSIQVPQIDMAKGVAPQQEQLKEVFMAIERLLPFAVCLQGQPDR